MLIQLLMGAVLVSLSVAMHAFGSVAVIRLVRRHHMEPRLRALHRPVGGLVAGFLCIFLLHVVEVSLWAGVYLAVRAFDSFEEALYFSMVSFTTLGFGDLVLPAQWRILGASEGMLGLVLLGWSTGLVLVLLEPLNRRVLGLAD
jgi:hypothetical protein